MLSLIISVQMQAAWCYKLHSHNQETVKQSLSSLLATNYFIFLWLWITLHMPAMHKLNWIWPSVAPQKYFKNKLTTDSFNLLIFSKLWLD